MLGLAEMLRGGCGWPARRSWGGYVGCGGDDSPHYHRELNGGAGRYGRGVGALHRYFAAILLNGLRSYGTEPQIWGGDPNHDHVWGEIGPSHHPGQVPDGKAVHRENAAGQTAGCGQFCVCGAWRGDLGLEPTPDQYIQHLVEIFRECRRVLRDDGTFWLNIGDSYASGGRSTYRSGASDNKGHLVQNDMPRPTDSPGIKPKDLLGIPWMLAFALRTDRWYLRSEIIWAKAAPMPESVTDRPTNAQEKIFLFSKSRLYFYDAEAVKEDAVSEHGSGNGYKRDERLTHRDKNGARGQDQPWSDIGGKRNLRNVWTLGPEPFAEAHFATFPTEIPRRCIAAGTSEKGICPECGAPWARIIEPTGHVNLREPAHQPFNTPTKTDSSGWAPTTAATNRWRKTCGCLNNEAKVATVLDPFAGAGTTLMVADQMGRNAIGIELNPSYAEMARRRIEEDGGMFTSVTVSPPC